MPHRNRVSTGWPYEPIVEISRAVRIGSIVAVSGTAPLGPDGKTVGLGDPRAQARRCIEISRAALQQLGVGLEAVIRTRILLTRIEDWKVVAEVHGAFFSDIRPVNTTVQVSRFIDPDGLPRNRGRRGDVRRVSRQVAGNLVRRHMSERRAVPDAK